MSTSSVFQHLINIDMIPPNAVVVDAGASYGDFVLALQGKAIPGGCRIFGIECNRTNAEVLRGKNIQNLTILEAALVGNLSPEAMTFTEIVAKNNQLHEWGNLFGLNKESAARRGDFIRFDEYPVRCIRIGQLFETLGVEHIDFLKMDIEGAEVDIFNTMPHDVAARISQASVEHHGNRKELVCAVNNAGFVIAEENQYDLYIVRA